MTHPQPTPQASESGVARVIGGLFRFLVRLLFVLIVGALIGAGLYLGIPWAYRSLVQPVQQNTARVIALEQRVAQEQNRLQDENLAFEERIAALEAEMTGLGEESGVQAQAIEGAIERVEQLEGRMTQAEADLEAQQNAVQGMRAELDSAVTELDEQAEQAAERIEGLEGRLALLQTAQDLVKVRLLLLEENTRSARDTLILATAHLEQAMALMPEQAETLSALQERMVALDQLIEDRSFQVIPELEALWADVMGLVLPPAGEPSS
jgi:predicted  nucleic acid-binding Zn-ribbon protein